MMMKEMFMFQEWTDINLAWNKSEYDGIVDIRIPPRYNTINTKFT